MIGPCPYCNGRGSWVDDGKLQVSTEFGKHQHGDGPWYVVCTFCKGTGYTSGGCRTGVKGQLLAPHFGSCYRCGTPWAFVEGHNTRINEYETMFPLCELCHRDTAPQERIVYYRQLLEDWQKDSPESDNGVPWSQVELEIEKAVVAGH